MTKYSNDMFVNNIRQLAKVSGVSANQYSKYLHGVYPSVKVAVKIANCFGISLNCLFGLADYESCKSLDFNICVFVERYENLLKINNITHYLFCKKYGLSESSLRRWKTGDIPNIHSLITISKNLSTSIDYLIGRE